MKKILLILVLVLVAPALFSNSGFAQETRLKIRPADAEAPPPIEQRQLDIARPAPAAIARVIDVVDGPKIITVKAQGKTFTFEAEDPALIPQPGEMIEMWGDPPSSAARVVCRLCYCPPPGAAGPCNLCCFDYQNLRMTGRVTQVNEDTRTFVTLVNGKAVTVSAHKLEALPKVGEIVDITYSEIPGKPIDAHMMRPCDASCVRRPGGCICP